MLQSLPRAYIRDPRPPPQLTAPSPASFALWNRRISPLFAVTLHGRLGLGLGPATTGLPTPLLHVHRPPLVPLSRPTPLPPRRSGRIAEEPRHPKLSASPMAPPLPSVPCLPGSRLSSGWVRLAAAVPPVAAPRLGIAGAGRPLGLFPPLPLLCFTRGTGAGGRRRAPVPPRPAPGTHAPVAQGPGPGGKWKRISEN
nr:protein diaphanous homolog 1-like isoform X2 [Aegilops tauschii subsp. strangulata]